jgi:hypothetical protein
MASLAFLVMRSSALLILATRKNGSQQRLSSGRSLFVDQLNTETSFVAPLQSTMDNNNEFDKAKADEATTATSSSSSQQRRSLLVTSLQSVLGVITSVGLLGSNTATVVQAAEVDDFASIAALASKISQDLQNSKDDDDDDVASPSTATTTTTTRASSSSSTAYDFTLPMSGSAVNFRELVAAVNPESPPKAIIVVNIKQDDPLARKNIPELISLAAKYVFVLDISYHNISCARMHQLSHLTLFVIFLSSIGLYRYGRNGEFVVVACPTDQGYFEADTSTLIRLKLASEYGYGINPATIITDKVNLLGKSAHPFWRWLEGTCRTPAGLGRVEVRGGDTSK